MFPTVTADQFPNPSEDPKGFERAMEAFVLKTELATCDVVKRFQAMLSKLPLSASFRRSAQWGAVVADPLFAGNLPRIREINQRLAELAAEKN